MPNPSSQCACNSRDLLNFPWTCMSAGSVCLAANKFLYLTKVEHVLADLGHPLPTFWSALPNA